MPAPHLQDPTASLTRFAVSSPFQQLPFSSRSSPLRATNLPRGSSKLASPPQLAENKPPRVANAREPSIMDILLVQLTGRVPSFLLPTPKATPERTPDKGNLGWQVVAWGEGGGEGSGMWRAVL